MIQYCSLSYQDIYSKIWHETRAGTYCSYIRGKRCQSDETFFHEISASFQFPEYFGENWNALHDCLCDLEWLCFNKIFITFDNFKLAYQNDPEGQRLLLSAMNIMVKEWNRKGIVVEIWLNN